MLRKNKGQQFASYWGSTVKRSVSLLLCIRFIFHKISNQLSYVNTLLRFVHSNHKKKRELKSAGTLTSRGAFWASVVKETILLL